MAYLILLVGLFFRSFQLSENPPGLFADEASAAFESWSLLLTGSDRYGIHLPVNFTHWGVGQNVLYSYLNVPIIAIFGLTPFAIRLESLVVGILTLALMYVTVNRAFGKKTAVLSMLFLAFMPWHIMNSRWGWEGTILPFFLLLGTFAVMRSLKPGLPIRWDLFCLVPWALAFYAYTTALIIVPLLLVLICLLYRHELYKNWGCWLKRFVIFLFLVFPYMIFVFDNFIFHQTIGFERQLPFGVPMLVANRLEQVASPIPGRWVDNLFRVLRGFQMPDYHSSPIDMPAVYITLIPLALFGAASLATERDTQKRKNLFLLWLVSSCVFFFLFDLDTWRSNAIYLPLIAIASHGCCRLFGTLPLKHLRNLFALGVGSLIALQAMPFIFEYFFIYPSIEQYQLAFSKNFDRALAQAIQSASSNEPIFVSNSVQQQQQHLLIAFYLQYPPQKYREEVRYQIQTHPAGYRVVSLGRFYFDEDNYPAYPFVYIISKRDPEPCPNSTPFLETRLWKVAECDAP